MHSKRPAAAAQAAVNEQHVLQVVLQHGFAGLKNHRLEYAPMKSAPPFDELQLLHCSWRGLHVLVLGKAAGQPLCTRLVRTGSLMSALRRACLAVEDGEE